MERRIVATWHSFQYVHLSIAETLRPRWKSNRLDDREMSKASLYCPDWSLIDDGRVPVESDRRWPEVRLASTSFGIHTGYEWVTHRVDRVNSWRC